MAAPQTLSEFHDSLIKIATTFGFNQEKQHDRSGEASDDVHQLPRHACIRNKGPGNMIHQHGECCQIFQLIPVEGFPVHRILLSVLFFYKTPMKTIPCRGMPEKGSAGWQGLFYPAAQLTA